MPLRGVFQGRRGEDQLRAAGVSLCLAPLDPEALRMVRRSPLGRETMLFTVEHPVEAYFGARPRPVEF